MTGPRPIAPARVLAALDVLGWPDDRDEQPVDVPPGIHYRTVEQVIQAADEAALRSTDPRQTFEQACEIVARELFVAGHRLDIAGGDIHARGEWYEQASGALQERYRARARQFLESLGRSGLAITWAWEGVGQR